MRKPLFYFGLAAAGLCAGCQTVPYTGRSQFMVISASQEKSMGAQAYQDTLKKSKLSNDREKVEMLRRVGRRLAQAADKPDYEWEFNLIEEDKTVNAWCLPGGKVAFYTGILPVTRDETGAAVVMGHEIAHALARHGAERMSQAMPVQFVGQAAGLLLLNQASAMRGVFDQVYGLGAAVGLNAYSRKHESEADHIGLILMAKAGYDPRQAVEFWGRMAKQSQAPGGALDKFLSTHPSDADRQKKISEWLPEALKYYQQ